jgi:hypothetical protein
MARRCTRRPATPAAVAADHFAAVTRDDAFLLFELVLLGASFLSFMGGFYCRGMPSATSSSVVAGRPLAQSTTSGPVTHAEPFHRSTTGTMSPPGVTGRMRTAYPFDNVITDNPSRNIPRASYTQDSAAGEFHPPRPRKRP